LPGVGEGRQDLLTGSPKLGGFGVLPLAHHLHARHAFTAGRLLRYLLCPAATSPPWMALAALILQATCPTLHPAQTLLLCTCAASPAAIASGVLLPTIPGLSARPEPSTLWQPVALPPGPLLAMAVALHALGPLVTTGPVPLADLLLPAAACPAARPDGAVIPVQPDTAALARLHWPAHTEHSHPVLPASATNTVAGITTYSTHSTALHRRRLHQEFVALAHHPAPRPPNPAAANHAFRATLRALWQHPVDNRVKATLWRAAVALIPGATVPTWTCPCSLHAPPATTRRLHALWDCPVAQAVRDQISAALPPGTPLARHHVWLATTPIASPALTTDIWRLVSVAALSAMEWGRACLWARRHSATWPDPGPTGLRHLAVATGSDILDFHIRPMVLAARDDAVRAVARLAAARFWMHLQDFVSDYPRGPPAWLALPADHLFVASVGGAYRVVVPGA